MNSLSTTIEEFPTTEKLTSRSKDVTNEQSASKSTNLVPNERLDDAVVIPVLPPCKIQQSTNKLQQPNFNISSSSSLKNNNNTKRNTIGTSPTPTKKPSVPMQRQHSSLRAKLLSSVKRRNPSSIVINKEDSTVKTPAPQDRPTTKENKNRHSWQHIMQRHNNNNLPLSPPSSPITPEHSKSVRLISWLKNKSNANRKPSGGNPVNSRSSPVNSSSTTTSSHREEEVVVMIPVARPSVSLLPLQSNTRTTTTDLARNNSQVDKVSIESELRVHAGDMNRSALTSKPPMEVLLEINKILLLLGIEVENGGGYKLNCVRRSTVHYQAAAEDDEDDMMNHLSTNHQPILSQPIYGHPNIDSGQEIEFTIEICRFQNLSGLFSVDIQYVSEDNYAAYQFIGQKLLGLLHMGNIIRNTNFNIMLSKNEA
ncbi:hypothetical protein EDC94DRAFT_617560 [Helicostylum pulchrum]|nr:hypothetical protein EDC94DRAFT_617560 [Helicostylum pulchrum]